MILAIPFPAIVRLEKARKINTSTFALSAKAIWPLNFRSDSFRSHSGLTSSRLIDAHIFEAFGEKRLIENVMGPHKGCQLLVFFSQLRSFDDYPQQNRGLALTTRRMVSKAAVAACLIN